MFYSIDDRPPPATDVIGFYSQFVKSHFDLVLEEKIERKFINTSIEWKKEKKFSKILLTKKKLRHQKRSNGFQKVLFRRLQLLFHGSANDVTWIFKWWRHVNLKWLFILIVSSASSNRQKSHCKIPL